MVCLSLIKNNVFSYRTLEQEHCVLPVIPPYKRVAGPHVTHHPKIKLFSITQAAFDLKFSLAFEKNRDIWVRLSQANQTGNKELEKGAWVGRRWK